MATVDLVRDLLRKDKVQLWLPPYAPDTDGSAIIALASSYADRLSQAAPVDSSTPSQPTSVDVNDVQVLLVDLREHAVAKLRAKTRITLVGRVVGDFQKDLVKGLGPTGEIRFECDARDIGGDVRARVCRELVVQKVKVIAGGRALQDEGSLEFQGWLCDKDRSDQPLKVLLMASGIAQAELEPAVASSKSLCSSSPTACDASASQPAASPPAPSVDAPPAISVATMRKAAAMLTAEGYGDFELADAVTGQLVSVPPDARQPLVTAIALYVKGREILQDGQKSAADALEFLVEADQCFERCREAGAAQILDKLQNYGELQLDICWAYALLGNTESLHDAEGRLDIAERFILRSVDKNFLTLAEVKADQGCTLPPEVVPWTRLLLLRGIARRCRNDPRARDDIDKAMVFLQGLRVEDSALEALLTMGASRKQAVAALRRCGGQADRAAESLLAARSESKAAQRIRDEQRKLGHTADGAYIDPDKLAQLVAQLAPLGVDRETSLKALKEANNDMEVALDMAQRSHAAHQPVDEIALCSLLSLGFEHGPAEEALRACGGNDWEAALVSLSKKSQEEGQAEDKREEKKATKVDDVKQPAEDCSGPGSVPDASSEAKPDVDVGVVASEESRRREQEAAKKKSDLDEARELIEREFGQCLRRRDADDDIAGATFEEEEMLLSQYLSEF